MDLSTAGQLANPYANQAVGYAQAVPNPPLLDRILSLAGELNLTLQETQATCANLTSRVFGAVPETSAGGLESKPQTLEDQIAASLSAALERARHLNASINHLNNRL